VTAARRELVRKSRLERSEDMLGACAQHIQRLETHAGRLDESYEFLWELIESRTLRGRWRKLKGWLK
jgi:hypothetical protein